MIHTGGAWVQASAFSRISLLVAVTNVVTHAVVTITVKVWQETVVMPHVVAVTAVISVVFRTLTPVILWDHCRKWQTTSTVGVGNMA